MEKSLHREGGKENGPNNNSLLKSPSSQSNVLLGLVVVAVVTMFILIKTLHNSGKWTHGGIKGSSITSYQLLPCLQKLCLVVLSVTCES